MFSEMIYKILVLTRTMLKKCGTTKSYISRIENDASDIRLSTFIRNIHQGLGGRLKLTVELNNKITDFDL